METGSPWALAISIIGGSSPRFGISRHEGTVVREKWMLSGFSLSRRSSFSSNSAALATSLGGASPCSGGTAVALAHHVRVAGISATWLQPKRRVDANETESAFVEKLFPGDAFHDDILHHPQPAGRSYPPCYHVP
jgi:hypothetical protein